ncbi:MAG: HAD family hydrolase [Hyphomicrobiaceae bacterium]
MARQQKSKPKRGKAKSPPAAFAKKTIALVYDFDGTLSPKPMQEYGFLPKIGEEPAVFWSEVNEKAKTEGADGMIVYMLLMYKKARERGIEINRDELVALGAHVELFEGVEAWFDEINEYISLRAETDVTVRHYLISSGLREIVEGTSIHARFDNVFASEYFFEPYETPFPKRVVTDTNKTQYLFRINKGIEDLGKSINQHMPESERPIPFSNMIYFGDGETDVPSMAVTRQNGGSAVAVHPPGEADDKCRMLYEAHRVDFYAAADYRRGSDLFRRTCLLIDRILSDIRVKEERWRLEQS